MKLKDEDLVFGCLLLFVFSLGYLMFVAPLGRGCQDDCTMEGNVIVKFVENATPAVECVSRIDMYEVWH